MANVTETRTTLLSQKAIIMISCVSMVPIVVNMAYVVVCFKVLRKKLHNLLVLSLCISDSFLGFSITWYCVTKMSDTLRTSVAACLVQYFFMSYGLISTYSLLMIISLERYFVVKSLNFGVTKTLERFRYLIIFGTLAFGLMFCLETLLFTHHQKTITRCNLDQLYKDQFGFFVTFIIGYVTILMVVIIYVSISTGYDIWRIFYRKNNKVSNKEILELESVVSEERSTTGSNLDVINSNENNTNFRKNVKLVIEIMRLIRLENESASISRTQPEGMKKKKEPFRFDSWEFRAFTTSIVIALTTIILTGPLIVSYWVDVHCGYCLGHLKLFFVIPLEINSLINPFIYAWRIPEIRQEFKKLFKS